MGNASKPPAVQPSIPELPAVLALKKRFLFSDETIEELYVIFAQADSALKGYLTVEDIAQQLFLNSNSLAIPALYRLYELISNYPNRLYFEEWVDGMSVYCLYNKQSLTKFMFDMMDTDEDGIIMKKDILKYGSYRNPTTDEHIFSQNFIDAIDDLKLNREFKISFEQFMKISQQIKFICWPAYKLQQDLKDCLFGSKFWDSLYSQLDKRERELKNNGKKQAVDDIKKQGETPTKQQAISPELEQLFRRHKIEQGLFKPFLCQRKPSTIGSDTNLCINLPSFEASKANTNKRQRSRSTVYIKPVL